MIGEYLKAVGRHWLALVTGPFVAGVWRFFPTYGGTPPPWLFWGMIAVSFCSATGLAWRDERRRAAAAESVVRGYEAKRPEAELRLLTDGVFLLLEVRNHGAAGQFSATVETDGGNGVLQPVPAIWDLTDSHQAIEIRPAEFARIRIASVDEDRREFVDPSDGQVFPPTYGWTLRFYRPPGLRGWSGGRRELDAADSEWFTVKVVVRSVPALEGNVAIKRVRLVGRYAIDPDSGQRLTPQLIVHDDVPYEDY